MTQKKQQVEPPTDTSVFGYSYHLLKCLKQDSSYIKNLSKIELENYYYSIEHWIATQRDKRKQNVASKLLKHLENQLYSQNHVYEGGQRVQNKINPELKLVIIQIEDQPKTYKSILEEFNPKNQSFDKQENKQKSKKSFFERTKDIFYSLVKKQEPQQTSSEEYHGISVHPHSE